MKPVPLVGADGTPAGGGGGGGIGGGSAAVGGGGGAKWPWLGTDCHGNTAPPPLLSTFARGRSTLGDGMPLHTCTDRSR